MIEHDLPIYYPTNYQRFWFSIFILGERQEDDILAKLLKNIPIVYPLFELLLGGELLVGGAALFLVNVIGKTLSTSLAGIFISLAELLMLGMTIGIIVFWKYQTKLRRQ